MSKRFNSFEEMKTAYPLNTEHNQSYLVRKVYEYILTKQDLENVKLRHPDGWLDSIDHKWFYYDIQPDTWYDHYIISNNGCFLGIATWDGIQYADEPEWGIQHANNLQCTEYGIFKTKAEAINYKNRKLKERLEF